MMATLGSEGWEMIESQSDVYKITGEAEFTTLTSMFKRPIEGQAIASEEVPTPH